MAMPYVLVTYDRPTEAIEAATLLEEAGVAEVMLVPRPRTLGAGCGVALRMPQREAAKAVGILLRNGKLGRPYLGEPKKDWTPVSPSDLVAEADS